MYTQTNPIILSSNATNVYYVSTSGSNSATGGTLAKPWASLDYALSQAPSGSTILLREGTYKGGVTISKAGITLASYPGEAAKIVAPTMDASIGWSVRIDIDAHNVTLQNLDISGGYYYAVKSESNWGLGAEYMPYHGPQNLKIVGSKIHDSGQDALKLTPGTDNARVLNSEIYNSGRRDASNAEGIDAVNVKNLLVQDNYIHDTTTTGVYVKGGSVAPVIERNLIKNVGHAGIGLGQDTDYEWFDHKANPEMYEAIDGVARNNIVENAKSAGIFSGAALRSTIANNTLINVATTYKAGLAVEGVEHYLPPNHSTPVNRPDKDATIINNIVSVSSGRPAFAIREFGGGTEGKLTLANNLYYNSTGAATFLDELSGWKGTLSQWKAHTGQDLTSLEANPGVDSSYHLMAGSPAIGAGYTTSTVIDDLEGAARTGAYDIGADESGATQSATPTPAATPAHSTPAPKPALDTASSTDTTSSSDIARPLTTKTISGSNGSSYLTGTSGNNWLKGNGGRDVLVGKEGSDLLTGGTHQDAFVFNTTIGKDVDFITDFSPADDSIRLENTIFTKLTKTGALSSDFFKVAEKAADANDYIVYNKSTGVLSYDADGSGSQAAVKFAVIENKAALTAADFFVI
jgi:Ca2+-binding RTX toxin-like protein